MCRRRSPGADDARDLESWTIEALRSDRTGDSIEVEAAGPLVGVVAVRDLVRAYRRRWCVMLRGCARRVDVEIGRPAARRDLLSMCFLLDVHAEHGELRCPSSALVRRPTHVPTTWTRRSSRCAPIATSTSPSRLRDRRARQRRYGHEAFGGAGLGGVQASQARVSREVAQYPDPPQTTVTTPSRWAVRMAPASLMSSPRWNDSTRRSSRRRAAVDGAGRTRRRGHGDWTWRRGRRGEGR